MCILCRWWNNARWWKFLIPLHLLNYFEIQKYCLDKHWPSGIYSRNELSKNLEKVGAYRINLDEYPNIRTHWIVFYGKNEKVIYFDSLIVQNIKRKGLIGNTNVFVLSYLIYWLSLNNKRLTDVTIIFSPKKNSRNDQKIL